MSVLCVNFKCEKTVKTEDSVVKVFGKMRNKLNLQFDKGLFDKFAHNFK